MTKLLENNINAVSRVFKLIELLVTRPEFGVGELSRLLKFPKTTVYRILVTLEQLGYVRKNPSNLTYTATVKFFEIGSKVIERVNVLGIAHPFMVELWRKTGETINLGVLDGLDIVCVDKVESEHFLKMDQRVGYRHKAYYTAFGKAVLAYIPKEERARLLSRDIIKPSTSNSLKTVAAIEKDLQYISQRGFAVDNEEGLYGIRCVGAPIFDYSKKVVAGISISGPTLRIKEGDFEYLGKLVMETAAAISERLGGGVGAPPHGGNNA